MRLSSLTLPHGLARLRHGLSLDGEALLRTIRRDGGESKQLFVTQQDMRGPFRELNLVRTIPGNDDAIRSIKLITARVADALRAVLPADIRIIEDAACAAGAVYRGQPAGGGMQQVKRSYPRHGEPGANEHEAGQYLADQVKAHERSSGTAVISPP